MSKEVMTLLVIEPGAPNPTLQSTVFDAQAGDTLNFVVLNLDGATHKVSINSATIKRKDLNSVADPLGGGTKSETIPKNKAEVIQFIVKPANQFISTSNPGGLPMTRYKYTVDVADASGANNIPFDPDFDITP